MFVNGGRVPVRISSCAQGDPGKPAGQQLAGFDTHTGWLHLYFGNGTEADEVFDHAGEGGEVVHGVHGGTIREKVQL